ncbi:MAG: hypothetical protein J6035_00715 [Bacteroidaceae bacterium]|nr:hypothetical protein [Bacteroidaceae bacterium]
MKKIFLSLMLLLAAASAFSQAKKPTLMVVPSDVWCNKNGFVQTFDNQGISETVPDYKAALSNNMDLVAVTTKIGSLMADRGFPLKDMAQTIKSISTLSTEDRLIQSKTSGASMTESPLDRFRRTAKADIFLEVTWNVTTTGPKKQVTYMLAGKDAYSGKQVAGAEGTGAPSFAADLPLLLEEAVQDHMEAFCAQLQSHFEDMMQNGRECVLDVRVWDNGSGIDLETEYEGQELIDVIDNWLADNTVQHRFNKSDATENFALYEQVRIPLYKPNGQAMDMDAFARSLRSYLSKPPYSIPCKVINRGLGRALLVIGEK